MSNPNAAGTLERAATLDEAGRSLLFTDARTANSFSSEPVTDEELQAIWDLAKWPPTSANTQPLRVVYVRTAEGKDRLLKHMYEGNAAKTLSAPVTAILAADLRFHEHIPTVLPFRPEMKDLFDADEDRRRNAAEFNSALQAAYFILAVRANGLVAGPMGGFDADGLDAEFFPDGRFHAILTVNVGHPGDNPWFDRLPRLETDQVVGWA
jgi:3-hydroxypropanoate dehydrogenase